MPTCIRCGEWSPPSSRQSTCPICRGELVSGERAEPAIRKRERFRELFLRRAALTPQEQSEYEDLLDQRAALRGQSRRDYAAALEEKWIEEAKQRAGSDFGTGALTLVAIVVIVTIIALSLLVVWWLIGGSMRVEIVSLVVTIALVILVVWVADRRKWAGRP